MIKAEWTNNDALSAEQTTHSNAHNTLNALDCVSRQYAIEHYQHVCRRTACKECPLHIKVTDTLTDCELELFLHNLPSVQPEITKEAVKEYCRKRCLCIVDSALLKKYTSVQPEQKKGKWIKYEQRFMLGESLETVQKTVRECSVCGAKIAGMVGIMNFCPNCGADMREESDEPGRPD